MSDDEQIYLPSFLNANVIRDQDGRCWSRSGYVVTDGEIDVNDIELFSVESSAICCEECVSNLETDYDDSFIIEEDPDVSEIPTEDDSSSSESSASEDDPSSDSSDVIPPEEVVPEFECTPPCIEERYEETSFVTLELCLASVVSFDCEPECQTLDTDPEDNIIWIACEEKGCNQNVETGLWYIDCCCKEDTELEPIINSSSSSSSESSDSSDSSSSSSVDAVVAGMLYSENDCTGGFYDTGLVDTIFCETYFDTGIECNDRVKSIGVPSGTTATLGWSCDLPIGTVIGTFTNSTGTTQCYSTGGAWSDGSAVTWT